MQKNTQPFTYHFALIFVSLLFIVTTVLQAQYYPAGLAKSKINLWYDASDSTSFKVNLTTGLATWTDKVNALAATSPNAASNPVLSKLNGVPLVEFNGVKGLNIADNALIDPPAGYYLAQTTFVYSDAPTTVLDFRFGTFTRNSGSVNTPTIGMRYISTDSVYRAGLSTNSNLLVLGAASKQFPDLRNNWAFLENFTSPTANLCSIKLNGGSELSSPYLFANNTTPATIGNRSGYFAAVHWGVTETVLLGSSIGKSARKIFENYSAWKWGMQSKLINIIAALYKPSDSSFSNKLLGIGFESNTDSVSATGSNNGLGLSNGDTYGFLHETGDYLLAADNGLSGTNSLGQGFTAWKRTWFITKNDIGENGGSVNVYFDFAANGSTYDSTNNYYLLYNPTGSTFASGTNYIVPTTSSQLVGSSRFVFSVDALNLKNGFYTLVYANKSVSVTNLFLNKTFPNTSNSIKSPFMLPPVAGNTFVKINWNSDSLAYQPMYYKIYAGKSPASLIAIDSTTTSSTQYIHYKLTNGSTYYYAVKAVVSPGKESKMPVIVSATPGLIAAKWFTAPQYMGNKNVFMLAADYAKGGPYKYLFECTAGGGHNSLWQKSPKYVDSLLTTGATYSYRFKYQDTTQLAAISDWSPVITIVLDGKSPGGFNYKMTYADNSTFSAPFGVGPSILNPMTFDVTGMRSISHAPAYGLHPRIYCNPEDSTDIRIRLTTTASGMAAAKKLHAFTTCLQLGFAGYSKTAAYNLDANGLQYITNVGAEDIKAYYDKLAVGDTTGYYNLWGGNSYKIAYTMSLEAFECWVFKGKVDATTNTKYADRTVKLAKAATFFAKCLLQDPKPANKLSYANRARLGGFEFALVYDYLHPQLTTGQRDTMRQAIVSIMGDSTNIHGYNCPAIANTSNWSTFGYEIMPTLAVEGEPGFTAGNEKTIRNYSRVVLNFLTYGVYSETGSMFEGIGKDQLNIPILMALAKRGYSVLGHPSIRAFMTKYYPGMTQPYGYAFLGTDLLGGTGFDPAYGTYRHNVLDIMGAKWLMPNDTTIDFCWKNYIQKSKPTDAINFYCYSAIGANYSYWNYAVLMALYASDYFTTPLLDEAKVAYKNNKMYFDSLAGFASLRSGFDPKATTLFFHNRQDLGGHTFANKNDFVFSGVGRNWIRRVSTNANSQEPLVSFAAASSCLLVNDLGAYLNITTSAPGKIVNFKNNPDILSIAGDATESYSYEWDYGGFNGYGGENPNLSIPGAGPIMQSPNDYRYSRARSWDNTPYYYSQNYWNDSIKSNRPIVRIPYNICKKIFRTASLIQDPKPYVIIVDDAQKDNNINNFKWIAQLATDLKIQSTVVSLTDANYRNDLIFQEPTATGTRKFLVRVLNNNGAINPAVPGVLDSLNTFVNRRLILESNSVDPQFKVLLFAYESTDQLPVTNWNANHTVLTVINNGATRYISFPMDSVGRTNIQLVGLPDAPVGLTATPATQKIALSWTTYAGATTYNVYRSVGTSGNYVKLVSNIITTNYNDTAAKVGIKYYYTITAVNTIGESGKSAEVNALILPPLPTAPIGVSAVGADTKIFLNWNVLSGATNYNVYRSLVAGGPYSLLMSALTDNFATDPNLTNGISYYYTVSAVNMTGEGAKSTEFSAIPLAVPIAPLVPTNFIATAGAAKVTLNWSASSGTSYYNIYRSNSALGVYNLLTSGVTTTSYSDLGLTAGVTYYYMISAVNIAGESLKTNEAHASPTVLVSELLSSKADSEMIQLSPNPIVNKLIVEVPSEWANGFYFTIFNEKGKAVYQSKINEVHTELQVNQLPVGIYFVLLSDGEKTISKKFIKK